jgi:hypothetical protein
MNLNARIAELLRRDKRIPLDDRASGIQFLRGVGARASQLLPAFYLLLGSSHKANPGIDFPPWKPTQAAVLSTLGLQNISLTCRAIFAESPTGRGSYSKIPSRGSDKHPFSLIGSDLHILLQGHARTLGGVPLVDLTDSELVTAAQACRAMAYQEGRRAKKVENPIAR